jgi:hypothetical protein
VVAKTAAIPLAIAAVAVLALASGGRRKGGRGWAPGAPLGGGLDSVWAWGQWVEAAGALPGFAAFATAAAQGESRGNNLTGLGESQGILPGNVELNSGSSLSQREADASCAGWEGARSRGFYADNTYDWRYWCFGSGGWFGLLPSTGLSAGGTKGPFANESPFVVFDPISSVVMMADFVKRVIKGDRFQALPYGEQNWLAVRRGMKGSALISDYGETKDSSRRVRERLEDALVAVDIDPDFMWTRPEVGDYPGAAALLEWLNEHVAVAA